MRCWPCVGCRLTWDCVRALQCHVMDVCSLCAPCAFSLGRQTRRAACRPACWSSAEAAEKMLDACAMYGLL